MQRWLVGAALCLLATFFTTAAIAVGACLSSSAASGTADGGPDERVQGLVSGLGLPNAAGAEPPGSQAGEERDRQEESTPRTTPTAADFIWPAEGYIVQGMWAGHPSGIDIGANTGEPVRAVRAGTVVFAGGNACCSYGYFIIIEHDDGWSSLYGHLSAFDAQYGDEVEQGERIGRVGMTGKADGPHVHFELRSYGGVVDPLSYLWPRRSAPPPPPYVASEQPAAPAAPAAAEPDPTAVPEPSISLGASTAINAAIGWLAGEADASYQIDASSCTASPSGPNWVVRCRAVLDGCADLTTCSYLLSACVLSQPLLVASTC